jgi:carbon monoxide dehydrogenase subunit G
MRLDQSFEVDAPLERVWGALLDIERVAPCLPGASVEGRNDDGSYEGAFKVKIGPTTASYAGRLAFENVDESAHAATMQASGTDRRGQGGARATIVSTLYADGDRTRVEVSTDYHITGRLARFGRGGMVEDIAERLLREFADNLQALLQGESDSTDAGRAASSAVEESQLDAGSLVASVAWQRARSSPLVPALIAILLVLIALRRRRA